MPDSEKPRTMPVKLQIDVIESARIVSTLRGEAMSDMLSDILRPILAKMEHQELSKRLHSGDPKPRKPKGGGE